jgi:molybdopterin/thiamine biosynthesis adenylyltransferase
MALARYFSKDLLALNKLLNTDSSIFEEVINSKTVTLAFDENAVHTFEGNCGLDLIIRLLARFYPKLKVYDLSGTNSEKQGELIKLAKMISGNIEIVPDAETEDILIIAGLTSIEFKTKSPKFYFGSENWIAKYSVSEPKSFGKSTNPFGSGIAACLLVSNIFRTVFGDYIEYKEKDMEVELSTYSLIYGSNQNPPLKDIMFKDLTIAGIGAVGNGVIWALSQFETISGEIALIDSETISRTNLQRYVLFKEEDEDQDKVLVAKAFFKQPHVNVSPCKGEWKDYIKERGNWDVDCVAVGIDSANDRIGIQSSLPRVIFNAFTEDGLIGISRHLDFVNKPCLACSYIPTSKKKSRTIEIAEECGVPDKIDMVKDYYNYNAAVNEVIPNYTVSLLQEIANRKGIPLEKLGQYNGNKLDEFYSDFICGGTVLMLSNTENDIKEVDAPLAFQSAMAGILLAAELVKYHMNNDLKQEDRTDIYHLSPVSEINPYHRKLVKDETGRCLCIDNDFVDRYKEKWST